VAKTNLYPQLADCKTGALKEVLRYVYGSGEPMSGEQKVWRALALMIDDELRFRDRRRKPLVPRG
jgi:hypothetical protein